MRIFDVRFLPMILTESVLTCIGEHIFCIIAQIVFNNRILTYSCSGILVINSPSEKSKIYLSCLLFCINSIETREKSKIYFPCLLFCILLIEAGHRCKMCLPCQYSPFSQRPGTDARLTSLPCILEGQINYLRRLDTNQPNIKKSYVFLIF